MSLHGAALETYRDLPGWTQTALHVAIVLAAGYLLLRFLRARFDAALRRPSHIDPTARLFLVRVAYGAGWIVLAAAALAVAGVDITALLGGLAIGGFIVGFALKDTLGNLAAGLLLLLNRPFNVGEVVRIDGEMGVVRELGMALTTVELFDGRIMTTPNGKVLGESVINYSRNPTRRADVKVGIAYDDDADSATRAILAALARDRKVLQDPAPQVVVTALADSSVELEVRAWAKNEDFGHVMNGLRPLVKKAVEGAGCSIPFPQREIRVIEKKA